MKDYRVTYVVPVYEQGRWVGSSERHATIPAPDERRAGIVFMDMIRSKGPEPARSLTIRSIRRIV